MNFVYKKHVQTNVLFVGPGSIARLSFCCVAHLCCNKHSGFLYTGNLVILVYHAVLHHEFYFAHRLNIGRRVAIYCDNVGEFVFSMVPTLSVMPISSAALTVAAFMASSGGHAGFGHVNKLYPVLP